MKILHRIILLFIASILLSSCVGQPQRPYYFPVINLKLERYFENELQSKKQTGDHEYYQRSRELLLQSGYFKRLSTHSSYLMAIEYNQFIYTSALEVSFVPTIFFRSHDYSWECIQKLNKPNSYQLLK